MSDHLWPARAEYHRTGTPVADVYVEWDDEDGTRSGRIDGFIVVADPEGSVVVDYAGNLWHDVLPDGCHLDLRDVTARAHAAMAWTQVDTAGGYVRVSPSTALGAARDRRDHVSRRHIEILCRMRAMDESVTAKEACATLAWAELVATAKLGRHNEAPTMEATRKEQ